MNVHDLPMVAFTLLTQMAVGTFLALGVAEIVLARSGAARSRDRILSPILYAIGPVLVAGLVVSMLHMNDMTNVLNVVRNPATSWLSREILFGIAFAAFGFAFAALEWFRWGPAALRRVLAGVTALLGIGLVTSESMIYYSLTAVPAWHSWIVPVEFFGSTVLLGVLAVSAALMVTTYVRTRHGDASAAAPEAQERPDSAPQQTGLVAQIRARVREINAPATTTEWKTTAAIVRACALTGSVSAVALLVAYPLYLGQLGATSGPSVVVLVGPMLAWRLALLGLTALALGILVYTLAGQVTIARARVLGLTVLTCLALGLTSEFLGRVLHYASMIRVGI